MVRRMKTPAAVAYEAGKPLVFERVVLDGRRPGEVLIEVNATGVCHTGGARGRTVVGYA